MTTDAADPVFPTALLRRAASLVDACRGRGVLIATAESCTGGLVAGLLTEVPGSSAAFDRGFVTYSNAAKVDLLGVDPVLLERHGAVSADTAAAMATGALGRSRAAVAVAVTGIAGPGGGSDEKPVGLVHFAVAQTGKAPRTVERRFGPIGRAAIRMASVDQALTLLEQGVG